MEILADITNKKERTLNLSSSTDEILAFDYASSPVKVTPRQLNWFHGVEFNAKRKLFNETETCKKQKLDSNDNCESQSQESVEEFNFGKQEEQSPSNSPQKRVAKRRKKNKEKKTISIFSIKSLCETEFKTKNYNASLIDSHETILRQVLKEVFKSDIRLDDDGQVIFFHTKYSKQTSKRLSVMFTLLPDKPVDEKYKLIIEKQLLEFAKQPSVVGEDTPFIIEFDNSLINT
jgi:hypothetical protein